MLEPVAFRHCNNTEEAHEKSNYGDVTQRTREGYEEVGEVRRRLRRRREVSGVETSGREARWRSPPKRTRTRRNPTAAATIGQ